MVKTRNDEEYEAGVSAGQQGSFLDDLIQGQMGSDSPFNKGYEFGAQHRYGPDGRYHTYDNRGSNDNKNEKVEDSRIGGSSKSKESSSSSGSSSYGGSYCGESYGGSYSGGGNSKSSNTKSRKYLDVGSPRLDAESPKHPKTSFDNIFSVVMLIIIAGLIILILNRPDTKKHKIETIKEQQVEEQVEEQEARTDIIYPEGNQESTEWQVAKKNIYYSPDDRETWYTLLTLENIPSLAWYFVDALEIKDKDNQNLIVYIKGGGRIETNNGGETWEVVIFNDRYYGSKTGVLRTYNNGETWKKINKYY